MTIRSRIHEAGHEHESEWPTLNGTGEKGVFYWDEDGKIQEGYPPNPNPVYDTAPIAILDSIKPRYHEGACRTIESRKEWEMENKAHNMLTFSSLDEAKPKRNEYEEKRKKKEEYRKASKAAIERVRSNPREVRQKLEKQGEKQMETLKKSGIDLNKAVINKG